MEIWTTFTPQKISWELTYIATKGKAPSSDWGKNIGLVEDSLKKLKAAGISGIRLVIYPTELTIDGKSFKWQILERILDMCVKNKMAVDLCIGPFQYPNYPGIYLPTKQLQFVFDNKRCLDTVSELWKYGMDFLKEQINRYGNDRRIHGFHLSNEWPDPQKVKGREKIKTCISTAFMLKAVDFLLQNTKKPIFLNTNINVDNKKKLKKVFGEILHTLGPQGKLGFDIYPSQFTWSRYPMRKLLYLIWPYFRHFNSFKKNFSSCEMFFAEVEAQPWGSGQSWYQLINEAENPQEKVLSYSKTSLFTTYEKYIKKTDCHTVSLWGSDFWIAASAMGIVWPLSQIKAIKTI